MSQIDSDEERVRRVTRLYGAHIDCDVLDCETCRSAARRAIEAVDTVDKEIAAERAAALQWALATGRAALDGLGRQPAANGLGSAPYEDPAPAMTCAELDQYERERSLTDQGVAEITRDPPYVRFTHTFPEGETVVSMTECNGVLFVATTRDIYRLDASRGVLQRLRPWEEPA